MYKPPVNETPILPVWLVISLNNSLRFINITGQYGWLSDWSWNDQEAHRLCASICFNPIPKSVDPAPWPLGPLASCSGAYQSARCKTMCTLRFCILNKAFLFKITKILLHFEIISQHSHLLQTVANYCTEWTMLSIHFKSFAFFTIVILFHYYYLMAIYSTNLFHFYPCTPGRRTWWYNWPTISRIWPSLMVFK